MSKMSSNLRSLTAAVATATLFPACAYNLGKVTPEAEGVMLPFGSGAKITLINPMAFPEKLALFPGAVMRAPSDGKTMATVDYKGQTGLILAQIELDIRHPAEWYANAGVILAGHFIDGMGYGLVRQADYFNIVNKNSNKNNNKVKAEGGNSDVKVKVDAGTPKPEEPGNDDECPNKCPAKKRGRKVSQAAMEGKSIAGASDAVAPEIEIGGVSLRVVTAKNEARKIDQAFASINNKWADFSKPRV